MVEPPEIFNFHGAEVRVLMKDGEPWFVAKDVSGILGYSDTDKMIRRLDVDEKTTYPFRVDGSNYQTNISIINESGLYNAILRSSKPNAREFRKWVTGEVLPSACQSFKNSENFSVWILRKENPQTSPVWG